MFNNIILGYTDGKYTFDTLRTDNAGGLVEPAYVDGLIRLMVNDVLTLKRYKNQFAQFKQKRAISGKIINSTYVNPTTGKAFTVDGISQLFDLAPADVKGSLRKYTKPLQYDVTYNKDELAKAFLSESNMIEFLNMLINSLYNGSEIDDGEEFMQLFNDLYNNNQAKIVEFAKVDKTNIEEFAILLKTYVESFKKASTKYNVWKRLNPTDTACKFWSNNTDINIILPISVASRLDIQLLAQLFNVERANLDGRVFTIADEDMPTNVQAIIFDSTLVSIDEIYAELEPVFYDSTKRRYKEVYNTNAEYGINPFANCVIIATDTPDISVVTVRSKTVTVVSAESTTIPLEVTPIGANQSITAVSSDEAKLTCSVAYSDETGYTLTVTATASANVTFTGITGTITVNV